MDIFGTVQSVEFDVAIEKQNGGTYQGARFSYRDSNGKLTEQNFTNQSLKYNPSIKTALSNLSPKDSFKMVKEKEGDFWNVKSIVISGAEEITNDTPANNTKGSTTSQTTQGRTGSWETPEERAAKQVYIIKQSSLSAAINTLAVGKDVVDPDEVTQLASKYTDFVLGNEKKDSWDDLDNGPQF